MLLDHLARGRPRYVHRDIAAADHHHTFADAEAIPQVRIQEKVDTLQHAIHLDARNGEIAAAMRTDGDHHCVEPFAAQTGNGEVAPSGLIELQRDAAQIQNFANLRFHHAAR